MTSHDRAAETKRIAGGPISLLYKCPWGDKFEEFANNGTFFPKADGFVYKNRAVMLAGLSGAGKTTLNQLFLKSNGRSRKLGQDAVCNLQEKSGIYVPKIYDHRNFCKNPHMDSVDLEKMYNNVEKFPLGLIVHLENPSVPIFIEGNKEHAFVDMFGYPVRYGTEKAEQILKENKHLVERTYEIYKDIPIAYLPRMPTIEDRLIELKRIVQEHIR